MGQAYRFFKSAYFGSMNSPYQFLPIGTKANVESFTADQMQSWYAEHVLKGRRVLAIFGDIDLEQAKALATHYFAAGPPNGTAPAFQPDVFARPPSTTAFIEVQRVDVQKTEQPLAGIVIGFNSRSVIGDP